MDVKATYASAVFEDRTAMAKFSPEDVDKMNLLREHKYLDMFKSREWLNLVDFTSNRELESKLDAAFDKLVLPLTHNAAVKNFSDQNFFLDIIKKCNKVAFVGPYYQVLNMTKNLTELIRDRNRHQSISMSKES